MNTRSEYAIYTLLIVSAAALSFLFVRNFVSAREERAVYAQEDVKAIIETDNPLPDPTPLETAIAVYTERDLFAGINELLPTPTKEILPTPTPTTMPLCQDWVVTAVLGKVAQIKLPDGKTRPYRAGDVIGEGHTIHKIEKDRVFVIREFDGAMGWLLKGGGAEFADQLPE
jgi:hypothetical protein